MKQDNIYLATWAKSNMIRRAWAENNGEIDDDTGDVIEVQGFSDLRTFESGGYMSNDAANATTRKKLAKIDISKLLEDVNGSSTIVSADRTVWQDKLECYIGNAKKGIEGFVDIPTDDEVGDDQMMNYQVPLKYLRSALCSGQIDGEKLSSMVGFLTMGFDMGKFKAWKENPDDPSNLQNQFFEQHKKQINNSIVEFVKHMSASQLANSKSTTIKTINAVLSYINQDADTRAEGPDGNDIDIGDFSGTPISMTLYEAISSQRELLNTNSASGARGGMNPEIKQMLGIKND